VKVLALALGTLLLFGTANAQADLQRTLVGNWKGTFYTRAGAAERIIVVKSVLEQNGAWVVDGAIGPAGSLIPFQGTVETIKGEHVLKFMAGKYPTELTIKKDGKHLEGWATNPENAYNFSAKFEKAE
jgi:hypothetical protein